ncbi:fumarate reductase flavoprotein subunit [Spinactinospora alkalitolerans]|uniref:Fumarate reductase flavoprotein subunit n=1 Tax=Spinactinospora alkalitolerans TaxID=687207 RepID=A0A852TXZ7_9ACTN|nr:FAD-binding protein [Spinactinospora alkalitolerans]NYE48157.1 fumarate reductase flavoprotein subunit [Spinactinospora alkalitolerans]
MTREQGGAEAPEEGAVDLVVAGAGGGLAGALRAAEAGLDVVVVEADEAFRRGNNTSMSTAMIPGAGTRWQRAAGVDDSAESFLSDVLAKTHGEADLTLATALTGFSAELVTWLADGLGLPMELATDISYPGHSVTRCHTVPSRTGAELLDHLVARTRRHPRVDFLTPARLVEARTGDGRVRAAVAQYPDGTREEIPTRALLLATNGYGADADAVRRLMPEIAGAVYHGGEHSRGDALRIGRALGAATGYLDAYQGHAALARGAGTLVGWATIMHGGVLVNAEGRRFGDETVGYSEYAAMLAAQPGATGWIVFDERVHELCLAFGDFRDTVEQGAVVGADDADGLAARCGLPADRLADTLAEAARHAEGATADAFGRGGWEAPLRPPYRAVRVEPALFHTQGGLAVDGGARVLREDGSPVAGLYASGGAAIGISGHGAGGYLAGNGLLPALGLAVLAADQCRDGVPA